jgi:hypothetical protein
MRKSRVLLAGVAVAAAAAGTTAFTGGNTFAASVPTVAGYGELAATGATVTNVHYNDSTTPGVVDSVVFTTSTDVTNNTASLTVKNKVAGTETVVRTYTGCLVAGTVGGQTITCDTTSPVLNYADFDLVALTVSH